MKASHLHDGRGVTEMTVCTDRIRLFITDNFILGNDYSLSDDDSFLERGLLDSTGILELISFVEQEYGVTVSAGELIPENFDSINRIAYFVQEKLEKSTMERQPV